jgi:hypothetical protein
VLLAVSKFCFGKAQSQAVPKVTGRYFRYLGEFQAFISGFISIVKFAFFEIVVSQISICLAQIDTLYEIQCSLEIQYKNQMRSVSLHFHSSSTAFDLVCTFHRKWQHGCGH